MMRMMRMMTRMMTRMICFSVGIWISNEDAEDDDWCTGGIWVSSEYGDDSNDSMLYSEKSGFQVMMMRMIRMMMIWCAVEDLGFKWGGGWWWWWYGEQGGIWVFSEEMMTMMILMIMICRGDLVSSEDDDDDLIYRGESGF
jgi:hypothetical protein